MVRSSGDLRFALEQTVKTLADLPKRDCSEDEWNEYRRDVRIAIVLAKSALRQRIPRKDERAAELAGKASVAAKKRWENPEYRARMTGEGHPNFKHGKYSQVRPERPCICGCGELVRGRYVNGHQVGEASPQWRGGRVRHPEGYIQIRLKGHPRSGQRGYVFEHILVAENMLGRPLTATEEVHHRNHIRDDNRPENLEVFPSHSEHQRLHWIANNPRRKVRA